MDIPEVFDGSVDQVRPWSLGIKNQFVPDWRSVSRLRRSKAFLLFLSATAVLYVALHQEMVRLVRRQRLTLISSMRRMVMSCVKVHRG